MTGEDPIDAGAGQEGRSSPRNVRCDECGCESPVIAHFVMDKRGRWLCPRCHARKQQSKQRRDYLALVLGTPFLALFLAVVSRGQWSWAYLSANLLLFLLFLPLLVPLHELAHAAGAWLMRGTVFALYFGYGWGMRERRAATGDLRSGS